jgi:hypothetical protein
MKGVLPSERFPSAFTVVLLGLCSMYLEYSKDRLANNLDIWARKGDNEQQWVGTHGK